MTSTFGEQSLAAEHDCVLLDLDGTVYRGGAPTPGAVDVLARNPIRRLFLTNNASRRPRDVAGHLRSMGFDVDSDDVVTSAQVAARLLADDLPVASTVLVIGTDALAAEVADVGLLTMRSQCDGPAAVVQGHSPHTDWGHLAEGALAIRDGALWVACNADATFPTERGLVPGNGAMIAALRAATGAAPVVAGKPAPHMMRAGLARREAESPLVVGDRLDTDIAGAVAAGLPSLLVLSGVSTPSDLVCAGAECRPTYVAEDLRGLARPAEALRIRPQPGWHVDITADVVTVTAHDARSRDDLSVVRAVAQAMWDADLTIPPVRIAPGDASARRALARWGLWNDAPTRSVGRQR